MIRFVQPGYPNRHLGVARFESALVSISRLRQGFKGAKGLATLLVAGAFSALVVVADQIVSVWADGQLLLAWVVLWALVFAAIALFAEASFGWSSRVAAMLDARSRAAAQRAADELVWSVAQQDPRLMADLQAARLRAERDALGAGEPLPYWPFEAMSSHQAQRRPGA